MKTQNALRSFDVKAFAQAGAMRQSDDALANFPRLLGETGGSGADRLVRWRAVGESRTAAGREDEVWLHLTAAVDLPLTCQRCLEPVDIAVSVDRSFRFVADEATAEEQDELAEEDVLVLDRSLDLGALIEDEVLMELPLVPRHEICPSAVKLEAVDPDFEAAEQAKPNPFDALQSLKGKTGKSQD